MTLATLQVKMLRTWNPKSKFREGAIVTVDRATGAVMIERGFAVLADADAPPSRTPRARRRRDEEPE